MYTDKVTQAHTAAPAHNERLAPKSGPANEAPARKRRRKINCTAGLASRKQSQAVLADRPRVPTALTIDLGFCILS